jgi:hypothetical protein
MSTVSNKRMKRIFWKSKSGKILLDFVNAPTLEKAGQSLFNNIGQYLGIQKPPDCPGEYKQLIKLFDELSVTTDLNDCPTIHDYTAYYDAIRPPIIVRIGGTLGEDLPFRDTIAPNCTDIITFCVIKFLSDERNILLFNKCENINCEKFYVAKRANPKAGIRRNKYCSKDCQRYCVERERIESGYHRDHKRKRRQDPDSPLSYHGYKEGKS